MAIRFKSNSAQAQAVSTTSTTAVAFEAKPGELIWLRATNQCYLHIGGAAVAAASATVHTVQIGPQGRAIRLKSGDTHFRVIRVSADGVLSITRLEEDSITGQG